MSYQHKDLAAGRWSSISLCEQLANVGSEVERALKWKAKGNAEYSRLAAQRALELIGLTVEAVRGLARRREIARLGESIADYFFGENQFASTDGALRAYFSPFSIAARRS